MQNEITERGNFVNEKEFKHENDDKDFAMNFIDFDNHESKESFAIYYLVS